MFLVLLALVPCLGLIIYNGQQQYERAKRDAAEDALRLAQAIARRHEGLTSRAHAVLLTLASLPAIQANDSLASSQLMADILQQMGREFDVVGAVSARGELFASAPETTEPILIYDRKWFQEAVFGNRFTADDFIVDRVTGKSIMIRSRAVRTQGGTVKAVVFAGVNLDWLEPVLNEYNLSAGSNVTVVDRSGEIMAHFPVIRGLVGTKMSQVELLKKMVAAGSGTTKNVGMDGDQQLIGFTRMIRGDASSPVVFVGLPIQEAYESAQRVVAVNIILILVIGVISLGTAWLFGHRLLVEPVKTLVQAAKSLGSGNLSSRVPELENVAELIHLAQAFNDMAAKLQGHARERQQLIDSLQRKNAELDEFTYVASHDLQEPLRKLISFGSLLREDLGENLPELAAKDLFFISDAAKRMQTLVQDLLRLSRIGRVELTLADISLDECVKGALISLESQLEDAGHPEISRDPLPTVRGDKTMLTQLYQNLIGNAVKYRGQDPPRIHLTCQTEDGQLVLGVRDNGIGIDQLYHESIFVAFKRLHGQTEYPGTGIGLAICRKAVERHGGRIWVESESGKGSHFKFTIDTNREENKP